MISLFANWMGLEIKKIFEFFNLKKKKTIYGILKGWGLKFKTENF